MDWIRCIADPPDVTACADLRSLETTYAYLLGLYLGDGMLTPTPRGVWRLRISQDAKYTQLIAACIEAMAAVSGNAIGQTQRPGCVEIYGNWKHWHCVFPQHGRGRKHERSITLEGWQQRLVDAQARWFLKGLIESDGCRTINRVWRHVGAGRRRYEYPRYLFVNYSDDIRTLFGRACDRLGVDWRRSNRYTISIARRRSVRFLDEFVGPKR